MELKKISKKSGNNNETLQFDPLRTEIEGELPNWGVSNYILHYYVIYFVILINVRETFITCNT